MASAGLAVGVAKGIWDLGVSIEKTVSSLEVHGDDGDYKGGGAGDGGADPRTRELPPGQKSLMRAQAKLKSAAGTMHIGSRDGCSDALANAARKRLRRHREQAKNRGPKVTAGTKHEYVPKSNVAEKQ
jgi:hypothetical protein